MTRKGNRRLRRVLYVAVVNMCNLRPDAAVSRFVARKKKSGLNRKAAIVAGCAKLARIIHSMLRHGTAYKEI